MHTIFTATCTHSEIKVRAPDNGSIARKRRVESQVYNASKASLNHTQAQEDPRKQQNRNPSSQPRRCRLRLSKQPKEASLSKEEGRAGGEAFEAA